MDRDGTPETDAGDRTSIMISFAPSNARGTTDLLVAQSVHGRVCAGLAQKEIVVDDRHEVFGHLNVCNALVASVDGALTRCVIPNCSALAKIS